jgi:hypothetical protein
MAPGPIGVQNNNNNCSQENREATGGKMGATGERMG